MHSCVSRHVDTNDLEGGVSPISIFHMDINSQQNGDSTFSTIVNFIAKQMSKHNYKFTLCTDSRRKYSSIIIYCPKSSCMDLLNSHSLIVVSSWLIASKNFNY